MIDKRKHIQNLNSDEIIELLLKLLHNMGIKNIKRENAREITGEIDVDALGTVTSCYKLVEGKLIKNYPQMNDTRVEIDRKLLEGSSKVHVISNKYISTGFRQALERSLSNKNQVNYWDIDALLERIEQYYPDYWRHSDQALISYEKKFESLVDETFEIKRLTEFKSVYHKLLSIFVEPNLLLATDDKQSTKKALTKTNIGRVIDENKGLVIIHGDPGTGKTRLLCEIGKQLIKNNTSSSSKRFLPVFIDSMNLREAFGDKNQEDILQFTLKHKIQDFFTDIKEEVLISTYQLVILIDSIDEFDDSFQENITRNLKELLKKGVKIFLGTRESLFDGDKDLNKRDVFIQKFSNQQVEKFTSRYFEGNSNQGQGLIDSLKENKVLEKLPITPLNLSLMSIIYEENQREIPATLNDIYDKFSHLLLGRTHVNDSLKFLDITIKEKILGTYALELLQRSNGELFTRDEFIKYFKDDFESIAGTVLTDRIPEALDYIIEHTGLLILHQGRYVKFRHDSYMEYFAAQEIFKYHRSTHEEYLIDNFFDINWQYTAIFFAGMTRQMPEFLRKVNVKISNSKTIEEYWSSANGMGYLLQALYLTSAEVRTDGVLETLEVMIKLFEGLKLVAGNLPEKVPLSRYPLPLLGVFPVFVFQDNFDSMTLKIPLVRALNKLLDEYQEKKQVEGFSYLDNIIYKIIILSFTLSSERLNEENKLTEIIDKIDLAKDQFYATLLEVAIDSMGNRSLREQKQIILKQVKAGDSGLSTYIKPASRHRFSKHDKIIPNKDVKLLVEGKTDALIIEHAYKTLTGEFPYWEIKVGDGGAKPLAEALVKGQVFIEAHQTVVAIFDNDGEGLSQFKGTLHHTKFEMIEGSKRIKKRVGQDNVYAMLLPVPEHMQNYIQEKQEDNYFAIEHYLPEDFLKNEGMLGQTAIPGVFKIRGNKGDFAKKLKSINGVEVFQHFILLFKEIDALVGGENKVEYH